MKLTNLRITPKLGILVGVTLLGLCAAGLLAGYLMQREMLNARIDQTKAIVEMGLNLAAGLKKQVDAGELTKEAARKEFGRRANSMTYDKGAGYLFGTGYDGITVLAPDPKQIGANRMDVVTNGRKLSQELMDGVKANGSILLTYEYVQARRGKADPQDRLRRRRSRLRHVSRHRCLSRRSRRQAEADRLGARARHSRHRAGFRQHRLDDRAQHLQAARSARIPYAGPRRGQA